LPDAKANVQINWLKSEDYKERKRTRKRKRTKSILGKKPIQLQVAPVAINILIWFLLFSAIISLPVLSILVFILSAARQQAPGSKIYTLDGMFSLNKLTNKKAAYYKK